jgi:type III restriction enzyme
MGPLDLAVNPQYTALIGSRGTGKSTILEYLRWALCNEHQQEEAVDGQTLAVRQRNLVENTLTKYDATVEVKFEVNGVPHMVRRRSKSGEVLLKISRGELERCSPEDIRTLLPIQAYSQKQLSRVGVRVDELDRFVRSGIKTELDTISSQARSIVSKIRQIYSSVRRKQNIANSIREDRLNLDSLTQQAQTIRESLTGLSDEQQALIAKQPLYLNADLLVLHRGFGFGARGISNRN